MRGITSSRDRPRSSCTGTKRKPASRNLSMIWRQGFDRGGANAAGVVQEDDLALALGRLLEGGGHDLRRQRPPPIFGIDVHTNAEIAEEPANVSA